MSTPRSTPGAARGLLLGALVSASMAAALSSVGVADAIWTSVSGTGAGARCTSAPTSFAAALAFYQSLTDRGLAHHEMPVPEPV